MSQVQQLKPQLGLNYSGRWACTDTICGQSAEGIDRILNQLIQAGGCSPSEGLRLTTVFKRSENALYQVVHHGEIPIAQTEIRFQDGCCPPHVVIHTKVKQHNETHQ